jgi:hypothetical protein
LLLRRGAASNAFTMRAIASLKGTEGLTALNQNTVEGINFRAPPALEMLRHRGPIGTFPAMGVDQCLGISLRQSDAGWHPIHVQAPLDNRCNHILPFDGENDFRPGADQS